jgi:hypothetical protein
MLRASC